MQLGVIDFSEKHANIGTLFWATVHTGFCWSPICQGCISPMGDLDVTVYLKTLLSSWVKKHYKFWLFRPRKQTLHYVSSMQLKSVLLWKSLTVKWRLIECRVISDVEEAHKSIFPIHDLRKVEFDKLALWFPHLRVRQYLICVILVGVSCFLFNCCNHRRWVVHCGMLVADHADHPMSILCPALAIIEGELCILACWSVWSY